MTKNEALKAAIDGERVNNPRCYVEGNVIVWNGVNFVYESSRKIVGASRLPEGGWQIVPEYVDFATAFKAYEEGKAIQSVDGDQSGDINVYHKSEKKYFGLCVDAWEIRGKWIILDD